MCIYLRTKTFLLGAGGGGGLRQCYTQIYLLIHREELVPLNLCFNYSRPSRHFFSHVGRGLLNIDCYMYVNALIVCTLLLGRNEEMYLYFLSTRVTPRLGFRRILLQEPTKADYRLLQVKSIAECYKAIILQCFRSS